MDLFERIFTVFCNEYVQGAVNNAVFYCESHRTMDSKKRSHVANGITPNKPTEKRARDSRRNIRGPLDFSSENVENLENLEPPVNIHKCSALATRSLLSCFILSSTLL